MKKLLLVLVTGITFSTCTSKKTDSASEVDSLNALADGSELALTAAPSVLASSPLPGYTVKNSMALTDSINFILLTSTETLNENFAPEKNPGTEIGQPDFAINYIIGVVCKPTEFTTNISIDNVEISGEEIAIFINMQRGSKQSNTAKASQIFSIERRDGISSIQFYVNGKKDKSFFMTGL
ncbi:hypothetical protein BH09BAC3_BH09BAC3_37070 [soil metagenome]